MHNKNRKIFAFPILFYQNKIPKANNFETLRHYDFLIVKATSPFSQQDPQTLHRQCTKVCYGFRQYP